MKTLKFITAVMLAFMVTTSFAARIVKSKLGDIEVTTQRTVAKLSAQRNSMTS